MQALACQWAILEQRGLLVWFPSAATIKWLASTFQPTMKLVIEPVLNLATIKWLASTHHPDLKWVMGLNTQLSRQFQPKRVAGAGSITDFMVGWKVEASHFIVAALGNHTSSPRCSKIAHWQARACIWRHWKQNPGMQKDGRCWLNHQLHGGLKGWGQPFYSGSTWKSYK